MRSSNAICGTSRRAPSLKSVTGGNFKVIIQNFDLPACVLSFPWNIDDMSGVCSSVVSSLSRAFSSHTRKSRGSLWWFKENFLLVNVEMYCISSCEDMWALNKFGEYILRTSSDSLAARLVLCSLDGFSNRKSLNGSTWAKH
ncbi:hypothetical protein OGAPHI_005375 [Ogataea philodendri]|uniref:Uncharacterized protein n=1 Tax=Ogataea philodendri TaxID=1378263 RepID=A0A9P8P1G3_9ASCO|nr:uncharacterized protein OGAPHI_005375 [Ogataea philodendri]KAH3663385.1 hypothetical protein OGAPHI_005375 [Ogataea philodendri]